jgi:hypothetical protein
MEAAERPALILPRGRLHAITRATGRDRKAVTKLASGCRVGRRSGNPGSYRRAHVMSTVEIVEIICFRRS